jgi:hypothetical protein
MWQSSELLRLEQNNNSECKGMKCDVVIDLKKIATFFLLNAKQYDSILNLYLVPNLMVITNETLELNMQNFV